jgi:hypothetical protein
MSNFTFLVSYYISLSDRFLIGTALHRMALHFYISVARDDVMDASAMM